MSSKPQNLKIKNIDAVWADLSRWLISGGSSIDARWFYRDANNETWRSVIEERLPFVTAVLDYLNLKVTQGASHQSIKTYYSYVNTFIVWVDKNDITLNLNKETLKSTFIDYDDHYYRRAWGIKSEIKPESAYSQIRTISQILSSIQNLPSSKQLINFSRVVKSYNHPRNTSISRTAEKEILTNAKALGHYCVDISNAITLDSIYGQLPIEVNFINPDGVMSVSKLPISLENRLNSSNKNLASGALTLCAAISDKNTKLNNFRTGLLTLKILAEFVIFIYQTGMNVSNALKVKRTGMKFSLQGENDWLIRQNKGRKQGSVAFFIYKDYKPRLKNLIEFVDYFFPDSPYLFPISNTYSQKNGMYNYHILRKQAKHDGIPWIMPRVSRNTRANMLNRIIGDSDVSSEMMQHAKETFSANYELPSQQRSMSALTHFWKNNPFSLINGGCEGEPEAVSYKPAEVVDPNCINESGCLWCLNHRDIQSSDYVWSLVTYRHLKLIEATHASKTKISADLVVDRLTDKIQDFKSLNQDSKAWVDEALTRIEEGRYHPTWENIIKLWEFR